jgi:hypothetical protein
MTESGRRKVCTVVRFIVLVNAVTVLALNLGG